MIKNTLLGRDLVSISDLSRGEIELLLAAAQKMQKEPKPDLLKGNILACCFFEPSTRTRLSFEAAMHRLGGAVIGFSEAGTTSAKKGEGLFDSMKVIGSFADLVAIRHPQEGSAKLAAEATDKPVINAGDGANQHPSQALLDLYTLRECQGKIDDLQIAIAGDLKYGRAVHSLCLALARFAVRLNLVSPKALSLPEPILHELKKNGVPFSVHEHLSDAIPNADILYMSRLQKERFSEPLTNPCLLKKKDLEKAKKTLRILHPLPRVDEIEESIDETPYAYYFQQAANGVPVRMALLALLLGKTP